MRILLQMVSWRFFVLVLSMFVVVACGSETIPLTGNVTDAYTGKPVGSAVVPTVAIALRAGNARGYSK